MAGERVVSRSPFGTPCFRAGLSDCLKVPASACVTRFASCFGDIDILGFRQKNEADYETHGRDAHRVP